MRRRASASSLPLPESRLQLRSAGRARLRAHRERRGEASSMPPVHVHTPVGPSWVGAVVSLAILLLPVAVPHIAKSTRHLLKPRKCPLCLGVGNNLCCHCKGRGKQGGVFTGAPLRRCSVCDGRGRQLCVPCEASGLSNHWLYQLPADKGMKD